MKITEVQILPTDRFMAIQRLGRVGREAPGVFIHYYTKACYDMFDNNALTDFENMLEASSTILPICNDNELIDIMSKNVFILVYGVDSAILTNYDLILNSISTLNGIYLNLSNNSQIIQEQDWLLYAQYMYIVLGYSLIDSLVLASVNRKFINTRNTVDSSLMERFKYNKERLMRNVQPDEMLSKNIQEAFLMYNHIKYKQNVEHIGIPFLLRRLNTGSDVKN